MAGNSGNSGGNFFSNLFGGVGNAFSNAGKGVSSYLGEWNPFSTSDPNGLGAYLKNGFSSLGNTVNNDFSSLFGGNKANASSNYAGLTGDIPSNMSFGNPLPQSSYLKSYGGGDTGGATQTQTTQQTQQQLPPGFEPTDEWAKSHLGMSLGQFYQQNPWAQQLANSNSNSSGSTDYYTQALKMMQPVINAEIKPLQDEQALVPSIYKDIQTQLQDQATAQQNIGQAQINADEAGKKATEQRLNDQNTQMLGQQRANAAANGFASTSGVEQSQEANINKNLANTLASLDAQVAGQEGITTAQTQANVKDIGDKIAALPNQQAKDMLALGAQIAQVQGGGYKDALSYASNIASLQTNMYFRQMQLALEQGNQRIAAFSAQATAENAQALTGLKKMELSLQETPKVTSTTENPIYNIPLIGGLLGTLSGQPKSTTTSYYQMWQ